MNDSHDQNSNSSAQAQRVIYEQNRRHMGFPKRDRNSPKCNLLIGHGTKDASGDQDKDDEEFSPDGNCPG